MSSRYVWKRYLPGELVIGGTETEDTEHCYSVDQYSDVLGIYKGTDVALTPISPTQANLTLVGQTKAGSYRMDRSTTSVTLQPGYYAFGWTNGWGELISLLVTMWFKVNATTKFYTTNWEHVEEPYSSRYYFDMVIEGNFNRISTRPVNQTVDLSNASQNAYPPRDNCVLSYRYWPLRSPRSSPR